MDILTQSPQRPRVVILGAGFGGLNAAKALRGRAADVVGIDRQNHHLFQPLLYQVATAALSPGDISYPIRAILKSFKHTRTLLGEIEQVDTERKMVRLRDGEQVPYDYLVVALGARHSYFGQSRWERLAPGLKRLEDALEMRRRILLSFEKAERETDPARRRALLTFVIVGGGPTGVELAGALAEIAKQVMRDDFRAIDPSDSRVILVEAGDRILSGFAPSLSENASQALRRLGCWVWTGMRVTDVQPDHVMINDQRVDAYTTLWAAGVESSPIGKQLGGELDRSGRVKVNPDLTAPGQPAIFVVGDMALFQQDGKPLPGVAPVAMQQGRHAGKNILRAIAGKPLLEFEYFDKGNMATIGRAAAIAEMGKLRLTGLIAWLAWLFVHILYLVGFRNRTVVVLNWAWAYFRMQRGARLIYGDITNLAPVEEVPSPVESSR